MDNRFRIREIVWEDEALRVMLEDIWNKYLGSSFSDLFENNLGLDKQGYLKWEQMTFGYGLVESSAEKIILMKKEDNKNYLYEEAFNHIQEGVQIYDNNAVAIFFNDSSRSLSDFSKDMKIEGKHLLDLYDLDEKVSTTLTTLKTGRPVINRVDDFKTSEGTVVSSANTSYPIMKDDTLVGTVVFEYSRPMIEQEIRNMKDIEDALDTFKSTNNSNAAKGYTFDNILGSGKELREALSIARRVASQDSSVLLVGETGTGKELFAQSIHNESPRRDKPFVAINCAAIPDTLIEGLLFGTTRGGFTGSEDRAGYFEEANGGTLFIDELNSMSLAMQSKLLRVVQEKNFRRVGGQEDIHIDIRFITSCNEDPFKVVEDNLLRKDLFYRLSTVMIDLPPLSKHIEDIETLIKARIKNNNTHFANKILRLDSDVLHYLKQYNWPGNVRELFHVIDYAQNVTEGDTISMDHLPKYLAERAGNSKTMTVVEVNAPDWRNETLQSLMDHYESEILKKALNHYGDNVTQTAAALNIKRQSLQYRLRKYGIII